MNKTTVKTAFKASLPVMAGYVVLGMGFGILLSSKGYSVWWALLMSVFIYAGSMQFVGVDLLSAGASVISTALMTLMVNARHLFYGVSMVGRYRELKGWRKIYMIFGLSDETYSLVCADPVLPQEADWKDYCLLITMMDRGYWIFGSVVGGLIGNAVTFNSAGIDFSMTALFVSIVVDQWEQNKQHLPAVLGLLVSLVCLFLFGADQFLIPSMVGISALLLLLRKKIEREDAAV